MFAQTYVYITIRLNWRYLGLAGSANPASAASSPKQPEASQSSMLPFLLPIQYMIGGDLRIAT